MFAGMNTLDLVGMVVSFVLTIFVLTYAIDDNPLFRLAIYLFIGVASGYAGAVALKDVILPRLFGLEATQMLLVLVWILLLALKFSPKTAKYGNPAAGLLVGVGAAIAVGGAIQGTLIPQVNASANYFASLGQFGNWGYYFFQGVVVLVGTVATLLYFHFGATPAPNQLPTQKGFIVAISKVGQVFIAITFGVIFAGVYSAALTALVERLVFLVTTIKAFIPGI